MPTPGSSVYQPMNNPGNQALSAAKANLQDQVSKGWITQAQADAEYAKQEGAAGSATVAPGTDWTNPSNVVNLGSDSANQFTASQNANNNPNQVGPFGTSNITYDASGNPTVTNTLSEGNQNVITGQQGASVGANDALKGFLTQVGSSLNGSGAPSSYENSVFSQLTRGLDEDKKRGMEQLGHNLANRGIPVGSEAYNSEMSRAERGFAERYDNARSQAVQQSQTQMLNTINTLNPVGQGGFRDPNFQPFQGTPAAQPDVGSVFNTVTGQNVATAGNANAITLANIAKRPSGGGGGGRSSGGGAPRFNIVAPPGS